MNCRYITTQSRRKFCTQVTAFVGAACSSGLPGHTCQAAVAPKGFSGFDGVELAIATICTDGFSNQHHEPAFSIIPELGYRNVEFNLWYPDLLAPSYISGLKSRCSSAQLNPISLQGSRFGHAGRAGELKDISHKLLLIEHSKRLGCRIVKCTGARRGEEGGLDAVIKTCRELVPVAEEYGILVTLENHAKNVIEQPEDYDRIFSAIDSPNIGMCLDIGHFEGVGVNVLDVIDKFGPRILQVDLKDCREKGKGHDTVVFGQGVTDFDTILDAITSTGYKGYLVVEQAWAKPRGDWKTDLRNAVERFEKWEH